MGLSACPLLGPSVRHFFSLVTSPLAPARVPVSQSTVSAPLPDPLDLRHKIHHSKPLGATCRSSTSSWLPVTELRSPPPPNTTTSRGRLERSGRPIPGNRCNSRIPASRQTGRPWGGVTARQIDRSADRPPGRQSNSEGQSRAGPLSDTPDSDTSGHRGDRRGGAPAYGTCRLPGSPFEASRRDLSFQHIDLPACHRASESPLRHHYCPRTPGTPVVRLAA